jgi:transaldolase
MIIAETVNQRIRDLVREGFDHEFGRPSVKLDRSPVWQSVKDIGTELWIDSGDLDEVSTLYTAEFTALTTNNTLLNKEVQKGIYDGLVGEAAKTIRDAAPQITEQELLLEIAFVLNARHGLKLVDRFDAYVSVELHTDLADDVERSVSYGKRYHAICPERFYVKVPLTPAGFLAARRLGEGGVPVNFTLGFSARQNYLAARLTNPRFVNVFMGRLNSFVADYDLGSGENVGEKATLSTQREVLKLREAGRTRSRLIGASMREGAQVPKLAGLDIFTMPTKVVREYQTQPSVDLVSRVQDDPEVPLASGVSFEDFNGGALWEVPEAFKRAVDDLVKEDVSKLTPEALQDHFEKAGINGFLPRWSEEDIETISKDGKIPVYDTWKTRLASGAVGLDALMNISALRSFATDQKALDDRVRSFL